MSVYVRWYGSILQGEVVENQEKGILGGMVAVRIQVQGMKATALFMPGHVYASAEEISGNHPQNRVSPTKVAEKPREIPRNEGFELHQERINEALMKADPLDFVKVEVPESAMSVLKFKADHWDHERNHLRIDALDEFYRLWCDDMAVRLGTDNPKPAMKMDAPSTPDETAAITKPYSPITAPYPAITKGYQKKESVELSLFD